MTRKTDADPEVQAAVLRSLQLVVDAEKALVVLEEHTELMRTLVGLEAHAEEDRASSGEQTHAEDDREHVSEVNADDTEWAEGESHE